MALITLRCKNCGSGMTINPDSQTATCKHCGSTFLMVDLLDEKDMSFSKSMKAEDLQQKIDFAEALKKGETYLYQAEYGLAEESFKRAIQLSETNHKGYLGVVKAKTANLNKIPETNDYKEFVKFALKTATADDLPYVKSELAKLDLLEKEKERKKQEERSKKESSRIQKNNTADNEKFWGKIALVVVFVITLTILLSIFITNQANKPDDTGSVYEITSVETLKEHMKKDDFLSSTIVIKNSIDFSNMDWVPIGTKNKPFTGTFKGNNHLLSNLKIKVGNAHEQNHIGFFGYVKNAIITGVKLSGVALIDTTSYPTQTSNHIGFVCGYAENTTIKNCEVLNSNSLSINHSKHIALNIGGVVGSAKNSIITTSYSNANLVCSAHNLEQEDSLAVKLYIGGVVGFVDSVSISNCYSTSDITNTVSSTKHIPITVYTGGIVGYNNTQTSRTISNCFFAGKISTDVSASSNTVYTAGIVAYGANFNKLSSNFALFENGNYTKNGSSLSVGNFHDNSPNLNSVEYVDRDDLEDEVEDMFSHLIWNNISSLSPSIK